MWHMGDVEELRSKVIAGLNDVENMLPKGPDDQIVPENVQEHMKQRLREILKMVEG